MSKLVRRARQLAHEYYWHPPRNPWQFWRARRRLTRARRELIETLETELPALGADAETLAWLAALKRTKSAAKRHGGQIASG